MRRVPKSGPLTKRSTVGTMVGSLESRWLPCSVVDCWRDHDDIVHEAPRSCSPRTHEAAREDEVARARFAHRSHEACRAAHVRDDPERDLREAEHAVRGRDAEVRRERELERHPDAHPVQRR